MTETNESSALFNRLKTVVKLLSVSVSCATMIATLVMSKLVRFLPRGFDLVTVICIVGISMFLGLMSEKINNMFLCFLTTLFLSLFFSERLAALPATMGFIGGEKGVFFEIYTFSWIIVNYGVILLIFMPIGCILGYLLRERIVSS